MWGEAAGFQAGVKRKTKAVIAHHEAHKMRRSHETRGGKRRLFCPSKSASVSEFARFPHPAVSRLPTRWAQVCVVCHLRSRGAVRDPAGVCNTPDEKVHWSSQDEVRGWLLWEKEAGCSKRSLNLLDSSWTVTGCHPNLPISLRTALYTSYFRVTLTH